MALVRQAALEFRRRGYHGTSMDDLANALGVTKGALYRYVKGKDEVLYECFVQSNRIGLAALDRAEKQSGNAAKRLETFMVEFIREYLDSNLAGGAMIEIDALNPKQRASVVSGRDAVEGRLEKIIKDGVADGSVASANPKLMILSFMGSINWIPSWFSPNGELTSEQIAIQITNIILSGLRAR